MDENEINYLLPEVTVKGKSGGTFWDKVVSLFQKKPKNISPKIDDTVKDSSQNDNNGMAAIPIIGTVITAVSGVFTSLANVKNNKLAIEQDKQKLLQLREQGNLEAQETLQKAIDLKIKEQEVLESKEKSNANIRALIFILLFSLIGFIVWIFFGKKKPDKQSQVPNQLGSLKKRNLLNSNI